MNASDIYWPYVALATGGVATIPFLYYLAQRRWTWIGLISAVANLVIVFLNGAAPFRGYIDPNYVGYRFGYIAIEKGVYISLLIGPLVLASAVSAWLAMRNRPDGDMLVVAGTCAFHLVNIGLSLFDGIRENPEAVTIQFGEYLTVPHTVAIPALIVVLILPFLLAIPWALQRSRETE